MDSSPGSRQSIDRDENWLIFGPIHLAFQTADLLPIDALYLDGRSFPYQLFSYVTTAVSLKLQYI